MTGKLQSTTRRRILKSTGAAAAMIGLAGCTGDDDDGGNGNGNGGSMEPIELLHAWSEGDGNRAIEALIDEPELVNEDPYGDGWMVALDPDDESELDDLLPPEEYRDQIE